MRRLLVHGVLIVGLVLVAFPFFWMVSTSLKTKAEAVAVPPRVFPEKCRFENYGDAWNEAPFARYFVNTAIVAVTVTASVIVTSLLAGYAFAMMEFPGKGVLFVLYLSTMMIPFEVVLVPNFATINALGWQDTYAALIVPWMANVFSVFLIRQTLMSLPKDFRDAALVDGCGHLRYLWYVAAPLVRPVLITSGLLAFLGSWNAFLWPLVVTNSKEMRVIQFGLQMFLREDANEYHLLMAASTFTILPIVIVYVVAQRYFIEGVSGTGLKG
jgi:multiple sugar transport system permease protein